LPIVINNCFASSFDYNHIMQSNSSLKKSVDFKPEDELHLDCICGSKTYKEYFNPEEKTGQFSGYKLIACDQCGLVRTDPSPLSTENEAEDLYDDPNYYADSLKDKDFWLQMAKDTLKDLPEFISRGRFLDIGCGPGYIVKTANDIGFNAEGIDLNPHPIAAGKEAFGVNIARKRLDEVEGTFDVICSNHVIEHVISPADFLKEIGSRLNDEGYLFLGVPNVEGGIPKVLRTLNKLPAGPGSKWLWVGYQLHEHIWHFSPKTFREFLEREGWEVLLLDVSLNNPYATVEVPKLRQKAIQKVWKSFESIGMADQMVAICRRKK